MRQVRTICYHRLRSGSGWEPWGAAIWDHLLAGMREVEIRCDDIGPGFVLSHGYGSVIWAQRIGMDCTILQHVTLGVKNKGYPTLGDRVMIYASSTVIGAITVGDDATVGAHSLVANDVPAGVTVVGKPARVLSTPTES